MSRTTAHWWNWCGMTDWNWDALSTGHIMNTKPSTQQTVRLFFYDCCCPYGFSCWCCLLLVMNETKSFRQIFHQLVVTLCVTCRNIFKCIGVEQEKMYYRNWNVLTQPHLFLYFQMNVTLAQQQYCFPTTHWTSQRIWAVNQKLPTIWCGIFGMSKNRHQILVHENTLTHALHTRTA